MRSAHIAGVSINQTVGDWTGNYQRLTNALQVARSKGAKLVVFPEMCIPGYSLGDRLIMEGTLERSWKMLMALKAHTSGLVAAFGLPSCSSPSLR